MVLVLAFQPNLLKMDVAGFLLELLQTLRIEFINRYDKYLSVDQAHTSPVYRVFGMVSHNSGIFLSLLYLVFTYFNGRLR